MTQQLGEPVPDFGNNSHQQNNTTTFDAFGSTDDNSFSVDTSAAIARPATTDNPTSAFSAAATSSPTLSASQQQTPPEGDSEPIRAWKELQEKAIASKDQAAAAKHKETLAKAQKDLAAYLQEYNGKKTKQVTSNRYV